MALAEPFKRILSYLIDVILLWVISIPIYLVLGAGVAGGFGGDAFGAGTLFAGLLVAVGYFLYFALMINAKGQTLGGIVMKVKVVAADGSPVTQEQSFKRAAWLLLQLIPCIGPLVAFVLVIWGLIALFTQDRRQVPWDQFAETIAVDAS